MSESLGGRRVPVTVITGFLGSGKTTLLRHILTGAHGKRVAVIENEFGEDIGVESLVAKDGIGGDVFSEFYEFGNGCLCCTVKDDLVTTLEMLLTRRDKFDYIVVETTGMANPGPVASVFWVDDELNSQIYLDAVVTVVDSRQILSQLADPRPEGTVNEAQVQIAGADIVLLNKTDLVDDGKLHEVRQAVQAINATATKLSCTMSIVPLDAILDVKAFSFSNVPSVAESCTACGGDHDDHSHSCDDHSHDSSIVSHVITADAPLDKVLVARWLGELLWENDSCKIFRAKGVISVKGSPLKHVLQAVGDLFDIQASSLEWDSAEVRQTKIVMIGRGIDAAKAEVGLRGCA